ncbi:hypothetical protein GJ699_00330 [Duganella sp. FT80W]|uniref:HNH endonuclease n=1 Tax=Duganella guangzhouensis TaxID=2666084 RepID=A0A6I2KT55_9BURK|nr:hypothetical protein [Duganella guangzhouensis]MRW88430.1 hypothetical protein [Duganella guangzhouensis]
MIVQIKSAAMPRRIRNMLRGLNPLKGGEWDSSSPGVAAFKETIYCQLLSIQNGNCAFCGLSLFETSRAEIEHIVPKGGKKRPAYPEYAFHRINLVLACTYCNGSSKKGQADVLRLKNVNFRDCKIAIVHPIIDDPSMHYCWVNEKQKVLIGALTRKGAYSIALFKLSATKQAEARAKQIVWEAMKKNNVALIDAILTTKI